MTASPWTASRWLYVVLAIAVAVWLASRFTGGDDEQAIRRQLERVEALIDKQAGVGGLEAAGKAGDLGDLLTESFSIELLPNGAKVTDRKSLVRPFVGYRHRAETLDATFHDVEIDIDGTGRAADMEAIAAVDGRGVGRSSYRVRVNWQLQGRDWLMRRVEVEEVEGLFD